MRNLYILGILLMFIIHKDACILGATSALSFWSKNLFPILFPTFILVDLIISSRLVKYITRIFGNLFKLIFKTNPLSGFVFFISLLCGTPTNAKILKSFYEQGLVSEDDITKILSFTMFFNPFLIISFAGIKVLLIIWISNIFAGIILRDKYVSTIKKEKDFIVPFSFNSSISNNMNAILNILGTVTIFMCISYSIPFFNPVINTIFSSFLELSTALYRNKMYLNSEYLYLIMLSIGGISIFAQIKSILKDTSVDYKFLIISRIIVMFISLLICWLT